MSNAIKKLEECFNCGDTLFYWSTEFNRIEKREVNKVKIVQSSVHSGDARYYVSYNFKDTFPDENHKPVSSKLCSGTLDGLFDLMKKEFTGPL